MDFQKATNADLKGILELQHKNLIQNLNELEQKDGFLSIAFTAKQFELMNNQAGIIVCKQNDNICGYLCTSTPEFNKSFELPSAMLALYPELIYKGRPLDQYHSVVAGPWCIERESRGKNIFTTMWLALSKMLESKIELIVTFISTANLRSLAAAKKVGMEVITTFQFNNQEFCLLAALRKLTYSDSAKT